MSEFYRRLDEKEAQGRIERLFANRPDNLHDYQGCANDPNMTPTNPTPEQPTGGQQLNALLCNEPICGSLCVEKVGHGGDHKPGMMLRSLAEHGGEERELITELVATLKASKQLATFGYRIGEADMRGHDKIGERYAKQQDELIARMDAAIRRAESHPLPDATKEVTVEYGPLDAEFVQDGTKITATGTFKAKPLPAPVGLANTFEEWYQALAVNEKLPCGTTTCMREAYRLAWHAARQVAAPVEDVEEAFKSSDPAFESWYSSTNNDNWFSNKPITRRILKEASFFAWRASKGAAPVEESQRMDIAKVFGVIPYGEDDSLQYACGLLDVIKSEWGEAWSEHDQKTRAGLSQMIQNRSSVSSPIEEAGTR